MHESARNLSYGESDKTHAIKSTNVGRYALAYALVSFLEETYRWDQIMALAVPGATYESVQGVSKHHMFDSRL